VVTLLTDCKQSGVRWPQVSFWALWHLPLFFIDGTYQNSLGLGTLSFWLFMIATIPESILMTWIFNNNQRSTLSAVLFHSMINITGELIEATERAEFLQVSLLIVTAITVIIVWGPKTLTRGQESPNFKDQLYSS
jgi:hypothetical protein